MQVETSESRDSSIHVMTWGRPDTADGGVARDPVWSFVLGVKGLGKTALVEPGNVDAVLLLDSSVVVVEVKALTDVLSRFAFREACQAYVISAASLPLLERAGKYTKCAALFEEPAWTMHLPFTTRGLTAKPHSGSVPRDLLQRVLSFTDLPLGWDGYGAKRIENATVSRAIEVLSELYERARARGVAIDRPTVGPTATGAVHVEWERNDLFMSILIDAPPEGLGLYFERDDEQEIAWDSASFDSIWDIVEEVAKADKGELND